MLILLGFLAALFLGLFIFALVKIKRLETLVAQRNGEMTAATHEATKMREHYEAEAVRIRTEVQSAIASAQQLVDQQMAEVKQESERVRQHYETEARRIQDAAEVLMSKSSRELESLRKYQGILNAETEAQRILTNALDEATALRSEAQLLVEQSRRTAVEERAEANRRAKEIRESA